jgi:adenylate cyclase
MAYIEFTEGIQRNSTPELKDRLTIGRSPSNDLCCNDASVSRNHAEIIKKEDYYVLVDLDSSNGTLVNGVRLHKLVPHPLYDNDQIFIGSVGIRFHAQGVEPPGRATTPFSSFHRNAAATFKKDGHDFSLSLMMTPGEKTIGNINATIDASRSLLLDIKEENPSRLLDAVKRLQAMVKVSVDLGAVLRPEKLVEHIMAGIFDIFPHADRAFILLGSSTDGDLKPVAARNRVHTGHEQDNVFPISRTVIKTVTELRQSILLSDAQGDGRFAGHQSIVEFSIRSLMCSPFVCKDELLGIIGVDTMSREHAFDKDDLAMITGIASQAAVAIKNSQLYSEVEQETQRRTQLSRYLSKDVVEGILDGTIPLHLGGEKKKGTILFCDIVGFTGIAEQLSAIDVVSKLNCYYSIVTEIITRNRGTLHKFAGDMVMAFWNVMVADSDAEENAVRTGLELQNAVFDFDLDLERDGQRPIFLGIGCNTGEFAGGNIGGIERMEYTVIGDNVNLAQRIESLASRWQVLIAEETYTMIRDRCAAVKLPLVSVKGRIQQIAVYSVRGMALADGSLLCAIPVYLLDTEGKVTGSGFISRYSKSNGKNEIHLSTHFDIPVQTQCTIQFDLPELLMMPQIGGRVYSVSRLAHSGGAVYTKAVIADLTGPMDVFEFFRAGACIESKKNWTDMRRY